MRKMSKEKSLNSIDDLKARNFYNSLTNDQKSIFHPTDRITNGLIKKAKTSLYPEDKVFVKIFSEVKNIKNLNEKTPLNTPFVEKKQDVDRSTLYSFDGPFEALQEDITDIRFSDKSAVDPKYCLLFVDLFTSMIYTKELDIRMEGAWEFQISLEYQIYCLFYCFRSSLKFKPCCQIWWQIQMGKSKVDGKAFSCEVKKAA